MISQLSRLMNHHAIGRQSRLSRRAFVGSVACGAMLVSAGDAWAARQRRAGTEFAGLVIGLSYHKGPAHLWLSNPVPDALAVADRLKALGDGSVQTVLDPSESELLDALQKFSATLRADQVALIYYAGHGIQVDGENYIVSADGEHLFSLGGMIEMIRPRCRSVLFFVDACRNNPLEAKETDLTTGRGAKLKRSLDVRGMLASTPIEQFQQLGKAGLSQLRLTGRGVKVVFATDPGRVALDAAPAREGHSPFAAALIDHIEERKPFDEVLASITKDVASSTRGEQTPWQQGSLDEVIYLAGAPNAYESGANRMPIP
jgi:uncharacterized caspase-like protein